MRRCSNGAWRKACRPTTAASTPASCATSWSGRAGARGSCRSGWSPARAPSATTSSPPRCPPTPSCGPRPRASPRPRERARPRSSRATPCWRRSCRSAASGCALRISPDAFFQTNTEMAERLYAEAVRAAGLSGGERVFDLYCGIGTIALALALDSAEVIGVESVERAVADAIANARANGVDNARFYAGDVRTAMRPLLEEEGSADVVVIDPPRAGLSQKVVRRVLEVGAEKIVYVSCNPTTLAPNARQMVDAGYQLRTVAPVDMFPQTPHIECVALLSRD
ncbi:MAG: 23S rRNA (uracil(1939)-C(5))-methyltransferase RlmD [Thermoleophilaceae bacterium]